VVWDVFDDFWFLDARSGSSTTCLWSTLKGYFPIFHKFPRTSASFTLEGSKPFKSIDSRINQSLNHSINSPKQHTFPPDSRSCSFSSNYQAFLDHVHANPTTKLTQLTVVIHTAP
jgi:hypothetical protein